MTPRSVAQRARSPRSHPPSSPVAPRRHGTLTTAVDFTHHGPRPARVEFETHGPVDAPAIVVLGGISADHHLLATERDPRPGWWTGMVGPGRAVDTDRHFVIGVAYAGGPRSSAPAAPITTADQARVATAVLDELGVRRATWIGASYGGMVGLAAAQHAPDRVESLVVACAAHRPHPMATAVRWVQRAIAREGEASGRAREALELARALAMTTYRSAEEFDERFGSAPLWDGSRASFEVEGYLDARGGAFADRFETSDFLRLSESIDLHEVDPAQVRAPMDVVSVTSDAVVPPFLAEELVRGAAGPTRHTVLESRFGHDAFLKESEAFGLVVRRHLASGGPR